MEVVLSQQLVEGGSGKVDVGIGATTGVGETVRNAVLVDIEAVGRQAVVDADDLGHHRAGKVLGGVVSGQCESESLVLEKVVVAGDHVAVIDAQQLGKGAVGVAGVVDRQEVVALRPGRGAEGQGEGKCQGKVKAFHGSSPYCVFAAAAGKFDLLPMSWWVKASNPLTGAFRPGAITGDDCKVPLLRF